MKTLHIDTGREMGGGQWQVLYLLERLENARLRARPASPLEAEARRRNIAPGSLLDRADLVHAHDARAHTLAAVANRTPLIVSRRVAFPIHGSFLSRRKYRRADLYIAVSHFVAGRLKEAGISADRMRVVYDGVPIPERESTREPGRVVALRSKCPAIRGIEIHPVSDLWQDLSTAAIFLYSTDMEGLGSAALAAMAAGVPVIASRVGGLCEIVEHERTGILVENGRFEDAVHDLLQNPEKAAEMGRRGRERVRERFSADRMAEETRRVYREVAG